MALFRASFLCEPPFPRALSLFFWSKLIPHTTCMPACGKRMESKHFHCKVKTDIYHRSSVCLHLPKLCRKHIQENLLGGASFELIGEGRPWSALFGATVAMNPRSYSIFEESKYVAQRSKTWFQLCQSLDKISQAVRQSMVKWSLFLIVP